MLETLLEYDRELFLFLNNLGGSGWDDFWLFVTNKWSSIPVYLLLLLLSLKQFGPKRTLMVLMVVTLMILSTDQLANFIKYGVQRLRPCFDTDVNELMRQVKDACENRGRFGYFSAHAANSFAVAIFFTGLLRSMYAQIGIFLIVWAIFIAYSRIYIGVHFPLDVLSGMLIGALFGWLFAKLTIFAVHKFPL
ncbi:MAG: phosphatase PAP2 family protein [Aurantibacter sp.]